MTQTFPIDSTPTPSNPSSHFDTEEQETSFTVTGGTVTPRTLTVDEDATISDLAPLDSPAFIGTPTAPTAAVGDNSTQLATTRFVQENNVVAVSIEAAIAAATEKTTIHDDDKFIRTDAEAADVLKSIKGSDIRAALKTYFDTLYNRTTFAVNNTDNTSDLGKPVSTLTQAALDGKADLVAGKVPVAQLPDSTLTYTEYANLAAFPAVGDANTRYIALDTGKVYAWGGSTYVETNSALALGETNATAYRGDRGKTAYDHSQVAAGNPHGVTATDLTLGSVDNTADLDKPISTLTQAALDLKMALTGGTFTGSITLPRVTTAHSLNVEHHGMGTIGATSAWWGFNAYYNDSITSWVYKANGAAGAIQYYDGKFWFKSAPAGTAGNPATMSTWLTMNADGTWTFAGAPSGPTPSLTDSSTKFATTAFIRNVGWGGTVFNVLAYGAVGDGVTLCGVAVNNCCAAANDAGGGIVLFPPGTYLMERPISPVDSVAYGASDAEKWTALDNLTLVGAGLVTIQAENSRGWDGTLWTPYDMMLRTTPVLNVAFINLTWDGNQGGMAATDVNSVVELAPINNGYFERCIFKNGRGYGVSLQKYGAITPVNDINRNVTFLHCEFVSNGWSTSADKHDGVDVKVCNGIRFIGCKAYENQDKGIDVRGVNVEIVGCECYDNVETGLEIMANYNETAESFVHVSGGRYFDNGNYGITLAEISAYGSGRLKVTLDNPDVFGNGSTGIYMTSGLTNAIINVNCPIVHANCVDSGAVEDAGIWINGNAAQITINNPDIRDNTGHGIYISSSNVFINGGNIIGNTRYGIRENPAGSGYSNIIAGPLKVLNNTLGEISLSTVTRYSMVDESVQDFTQNGTDVIASAATITLPSGGRIFWITGNTGITAITGSFRNRVVTLMFTGTVTVTDGSNLRLAGNYTSNGGTNYDSLTLGCEGASWFEISRSVN